MALKFSSLTNCDETPPPVVEIKAKTVVNFGIWKKQYSVKRSYKTHLYVRSSSQKIIEKFLQEKIRLNTNGTNFRIFWLE